MRYRFYLLIAGLILTGGCVNESSDVLARPVVPSSQLVVSNLSSDQMYEYAAGLLGNTWTTFLSSQFPQLKAPSVLYVPAAASITTNCTDGGILPGAKVGPNDLGQCQDDIYLGQYALFDGYKVDPLVSAVSLVSMIAYYAQHHSGVTKSASLSLRVTQGDCVAGAWIQFAIDSHLQGASDIVVKRWLEHSITRRQAYSPPLAIMEEAVKHGRQHGVEGCSSRYFPNNPLKSAK